MCHGLHLLRHGSRRAGTNLSAGEIVAQVLYFARYLADPDAAPATAVERPTRVTNIVLMGWASRCTGYDACGLRSGV
ncbi:MAG: hypothetical protein R3A10_22840 [Caldilineaceae bacterium]